MNVSSLFLAIDAVVTTIYTNGSLDLPQTGVIQIETEQIKYEFVSDASFVRCTRGYNSTVAAAHAKGTPIDYVGAVVVPTLFEGQVISKGVADSGGVGYKLLRVPN